MISHSSAHDLLRISHTYEAMIEITTACNLRCAYCNVSMPDWKDTNLPTDKYDNIVTGLLARQVQVVHLHGHGETTIIPGWYKLANQLLDLGIRVSICSNLMKSFEPIELNTLSKLSNLTVSIDTVDHDLFKKLRCGGTLQRLMHNLITIRNIAKANNRHLNVSWSIVVCNLSLDGLIDLVKEAINLRINGLTFCNLGYFDNPLRKVQLCHIAEMSTEVKERAISIFDTIKDMCSAHGILCDVQPGIIDSLIPNINSKPARVSLGLI